MAGKIGREAAVCLGGAKNTGRAWAQDSQLAEIS